MRTAFINQLTQEAARNERIFLMVGDLGYNVVEPFRDQFPNRFLNAGIAEQNMTGMAAGLAREGYNVYIYSIANFPTLRCMEQIRNDVAYYNANVKIVAVGAGFAYGSLGVSHHATEEIGIMRTLPGMVVASPSDPGEARTVAALSATYDGAMYIRLGKAGEKQVFPNPEETLTIGQLHCLRESESPNALLVTGNILHEATETIRQWNVDTAIYSVPFIKPLDCSQLTSIATRHPNIITLEEHQSSCGLGSAVVEQLSDAFAEGSLHSYPHIRRLAVSDRFVHVSGSQQYLREATGLSLQKTYFV